MKILSKIQYWSNNLKLLSGVVKLKISCPFMVEGMVLSVFRSLIKFLSSITLSITSIVSINLTCINYFISAYCLIVVINNPNPFCLCTLRSSAMPREEKSSLLTFLSVE